MRETVRLIGSAVRRASIYLPIRNHAASLATTAGPKDYLGQVRAVYNDIITRWRYVKDPVSKELLSYDPHVLWQLVLGGDGIGVGKGKGAGDCDCVAGITGAMLESIGFPVRIAITSPLHTPPGRLFAHVFIQCKVPKLGWVSVDPVLHPNKGFGATPTHSRIAFFDLRGNYLGARGNHVGLSGTDEQGENSMYNQAIAPLSQWQDMGLGSADGADPEDWRAYGPEDFGSYADTLGIVDCSGLGIAAEVDYELLRGDDGITRVGARTPILEVDPSDLQYVRQHGRPYDGMGAVSDTGAIYAYDGLGGFFSKIFSAAKSVVKKVGGGIKKIIKKIPGGKYLIKLGSKIYKIAKKFVAPLTKFIGKYATKLAPIAALIPGYGPAIAAGLYTAGKIANIMNKYGVLLKGKKGKARKLKFKSSKTAKQFQRSIKKAAKKERRKRKSKGKGAYAAAIRSKARKKGMLKGIDDFDTYDEPSNDEPANDFLGAVNPVRRARRAIRQSRKIAALSPMGARRRWGWGRPARGRGPYAHLFPRVPPGPLRKKLIGQYLKKHPEKRVS